MNSEHKRIFIAFLLSAGVMFAWQHFFPVAPTNSITKETPIVKESQVVEVKNEVVERPVQVKKEEPLSFFDLVREQETFTIASDLSLANIKSAKAVFPFSEIVGALENQYPFVFQVENEGLWTSVSLVFNNSGSEFSGEDSATGIKVIGKVLDNGKLDFKLSSQVSRKYRFILNSSSKVLENKQRRDFIYLAKDVERVDVGEENKVGDGDIKWFGIDFHYHLFSIIFENKQQSTFEIQKGKWVLSTVTPQSEVSFSFVFLKKDYDVLASMGEKLNLSVDFGILGMIAVPILKGLQFIYRVIPNYGWAIVFLTLFIRFVLFPLQLKSFKSMKKMKEIQPELQKIKAKHKDNPMKAQQETMELFKRAGANPMGGCLPLLLQMPVFFAFYRVLSSSVELVGAPFIFWIHDLSSKDPFYVLPIIMGLAMFLQSKLNPSATTDDTAQKVMLFMPLIFSFFMKDLPAGLNLYMCISTLFGIAQQMLVYKFSD